MGNFIHRLISGARVSRASSTAFATVGTSVTTLLLLPLLDVLFDVLMGADLSAPNLVRTGYAAALAAVAICVSGGVVSSAVADRNLGIFYEVHTRRRVDAAYWLAISIVPLILSLPTGAAAVGAVFALSPAHDVAMLSRVACMVPAVVLCGLLMGVGAAGIGVDLPDPYLGATIISLVLPLLTGVVVPLSVCPQWLRLIAGLVPLSGTLSAIDTTGNVPLLLGRDLAVALAWAVAGLSATHHAVTRLRAGLRRDVI